MDPLERTSENHHGNIGWWVFLSQTSPQGAPGKPSSAGGVTVQWGKAKAMVLCIWVNSERRDEGPACQDWALTAAQTG